MCGRYVCYTQTEDDVEEELGLAKGSLKMAVGDVRPTDSPVVLTGGRGESGARSYSDAIAGTGVTGANSSFARKVAVDGATDIRITRMPWGLKEKSLIINARAETALEKPTFGDSILRRRCIMPAGAFYEWDKDKNKVTFFRQDDSPIYLAGFYQLSDNKDSFVILTTAANESMIKVHDRMPLMIEKDAVRDWLNDSDAAKEMLKAPMPQLKSRREYEQLSLF